MNVISDIKNYFLLILMGSSILFCTYPTSFNPIINIQYQTPFHSHITMKVLDRRGRLVTHLVNKLHSPGAYDILWDAGGFSSGIHFLQYILRGDNLPASQRFQIEKIVLLK